MINSIITLAFSIMSEAIKKKRGKVYRFLIDEKTQNTIHDFFHAYVALIATLEDKEEE